MGVDVILLPDNNFRGNIHTAVRTVHLSHFTAVSTLILLYSLFKMFAPGKCRLRSIPGICPRDASIRHRSVVIPSKDDNSLSYYYTNTPTLIVQNVG